MGFKGENIPCSFVKHLMKYVFLFSGFKELHCDAAQPESWRQDRQAQRHRRQHHVR